MIGQPSSTFQVTSRDLSPVGVTPTYTRGTGLLQTIDSKVVVAPVPVQSGGAGLGFLPPIGPLTYRALLYELHNPTGEVSDISPNWFGVAIPNPGNFDLNSDVYVVLYFHPIPGQAGYRDQDYLAKSGTHGGTDWKQLYAYVDRLGGQMAGAIQSGALANRLVIFPFLKSAQYTLLISDWFNIIHDILQDINTNVVNGICTRPKKLIVASVSNGSFYLNKFLVDAATHPNNNNIIEAWDFDSDITNPNILVDPLGKHLRAYWQQPNNNRIPPGAHFIQLPASSWNSFPNPPPVEVPPLPPNASNSNSSPDTRAVDRFHHYIRDTMFLDAVFNIENDNP